MAVKEAARRVDLPGSIESLTTLDTLGRRLAWSRMRKDLTQLALAKSLNKSRATVVQYEQDNINPPIEIVEQMARILKVPPEFIAFGRYGVEAVKGGSEMLPISEIVMGRDGEYAATGHALSRRLLADFGMENDNLKMFVLNHAANAFNLPVLSRVIVASNQTELSRDKLYLVRTSDGYEVISIEPTLGSSRNMVTIRSGSGRTQEITREKLDVIGAIFASITPALSG